MPVNEEADEVGDVLDQVTIVKVRIERKFQFYAWPFFFCNRFHVLFVYAIARLTGTIHTTMSINKET
jgi:hypothetical protein